MQKSVNAQSVRDCWDSGFFVKEKGQKDFSTHKTPKESVVSRSGKSNLPGEDKVATNPR